MSNVFQTTPFAISSLARFYALSQARWLCNTAIWLMSKRAGGVSGLFRHLCTACHVAIAWSSLDPFSSGKKYSY